MVVILKEVRAANAVSFQMGRSDDRLARRVSEEAQMRRRRFLAAGLYFSYED
jgi:hypothetical protein